MLVTACLLAAFALLASTTCQDLSAVDDDDDLYIIHEFDADYLERAAVNVRSAGALKADPEYTVEYVATKEELDTEREFAKTYGVSVGYLREVQQRAKQGHVGRIEAEDSDSLSKSEAGSPSKDTDSEAVTYAPAAAATIKATKDENCDPPKAVPDQQRPWKAPTRVKAASRPDNGVALMVLVVVVVAVVLTTFIVIMWCSYSCLV